MYLNFYVLQAPENTANMEEKLPIRKFARILAESTATIGWFFAVITNASVRNISTPAATAEYYFSLMVPGISNTATDWTSVTATIL